VEIAVLKEEVSRLEMNIRKLSHNEDETWEQRWHSRCDGIIP